VASRRSSFKDASTLGRCWDGAWSKEGSPFQKWTGDFGPSAVPATASGAARAPAPSTSPTVCTSASSKLRELDWDAAAEPKTLEFSSIRLSRDEFGSSARLLLPEAPREAPSVVGAALGGDWRAAAQGAVQHFRREATAILREFLEFDVSRTPPGQADRALQPPDPAASAGERFQGFEDAWKDDASSTTATTNLPSAMNEEVGHSLSSTFPGVNEGFISPWEGFSRSSGRRAWPGARDASVGAHDASASPSGVGSSGGRHGAARAPPVPPQELTASVASSAGLFAPPAEHSDRRQRQCRGEFDATRDAPVVDERPLGEQFMNAAPEEPAASSGGLFAPLAEPSGHRQWCAEFDAGPDPSAVDQRPLGEQCMNVAPEELAVSAASSPGLLAPPAERCGSRRLCQEFDARLDAPVADQWPLGEQYTRADPEEPVVSAASSTGPSSSAAEHSCHRQWPAEFNARPETPGVFQHPLEEQYIGAAPQEPPASVASPASRLTPAADDSGGQRQCWELDEGFDAPALDQHPPSLDQHLLGEQCMSAASEDTRPADESEWPRSPRVDDAMDEVTRHLMHARDKIEAVELEFAQIMSELANYGERWGEGPPPTDAWEEPRAGYTEYFCINTPTPNKPDMFLFAPTGSPVELARPLEPTRLAPTLPE